MDTAIKRLRIGVIASCLKQSTPAATVAVARQAGVECLCVSNRRPDGTSAAQWAKTWLDAARPAGIEIVSTVTGFPQEDYSSIAAIHRTGGLVPDEPAQANIANVRDAVEFTHGLGADLLTFHAGFIPESPADPVFGKLRDRLARCADDAAKLGVRIGLESGQESAVALKQFLDALGRPNVGVNFDPANMILYGRQNPIDAVAVLAGRIFQVHAKDGRWSSEPGREWGKEVPLGEGDVNFPKFMAALSSAGFTGTLIIEREAGSQPIDDIRAGTAFLQTLCGISAQ
jgi:sugar phosphate isomerase/epimerase